MNNNPTGLTTIQQVREDYEFVYDWKHTNSYAKLELKCWLYHSESRHRNGNAPFTYDNYTKHLNNSAIWEQVVLNLIDVEDLGGIKAVKEILGIK